MEIIIIIIIIIIIKCSFYYNIINYNIIFKKAFKINNNKCLDIL